MSDKALYLECYSGISGDMTIGTLLDLGASFQRLQQELAKLPVSGYRLTMGRTAKCGIDVCDFDVILEEVHENSQKGQNHEDSHVHEMQACTEEHGHVRGVDTHQEGHSHARYAHREEHAHSGHAHAHTHRHYKEIREMIENSALSRKVKDISLSIFYVLACAEAKVHGKTVEDVAFHEVGAVDSIVDIVGTAICMEELGISQIYVSSMYEGQGHVWCQHGRVPVPAPAVMELAVAHNLPVHITDVQGEMITPTGAAIVAACRAQDSNMEQYRMVRVGMGAGKKEFPHANILRGILLEKKTEFLEADRESVMVLESNIDDCSGEALGYAIGLLMKAGALDASVFPCLMKKNRPGYMLQVICREEKAAKLESVIFRGTTAIGLRKYQEDRSVLARSMEVRDTIYGPVHFKVCEHHGEIYAYPEYEDISRICDETGKSYGAVYDELTR